MRKKSKGNRYKPDPEVARMRKERINRVLQAKGQIMAPVVILILLSVLAVYVYDLAVQSPFFMIQNVEVTGNRRVNRNEILELAGVTTPRNIFQVNTRTMAARLTTHPWVAKARVQRISLTDLEIRLTEQEALAVVNVRNIARVLINSQGTPFKELDPDRDQVGDLPEISGVDLVEVPGSYIFDGPLYNPMLDLLRQKDIPTIVQAHTDDTQGLTVKTRDIYNANTSEDPSLMSLKLGKTDFREKLNRAREIADYMNTHFPRKIIQAMDLFNLETIFVKTSDTATLEHNTEKGA